MAISETSRKSLSQTLGVLSIAAGAAFGFYAIVRVIEFIKLTILFEGSCLPETIIVGFYNFILAIIAILFLFQGDGLLKLKKWTPRLVLIILILVFLVNGAYFTYDYLTVEEYWDGIELHNIIQQFLPAALSIVFSVFSFTNKTLFRE